MMKRLLTILMLATVGCVLNTFSAEAATYIKEIAVASTGDGDESKNILRNAGFDHIVDYDLNRNAGGKYIYVGYKTTSNYTEAITDIVVQRWSGNKNITIGDKYYQQITVLAGNGDCNEGAGGKDLFILYSKSGHEKGVSAVTSLAVNTNYGDPVHGYEGTTLVEEKQDMNRKAGGDDIFLWMTKENFTLPIEGNGSSGNPFLLKSVSDLEFFRDLVNNDNLHWLCAKLKADLDMNNVSWMPIGTFMDKGPQVTYTGTFDGDNHIIRNLKGNNESVHDMGLIGRANGCTVKNLMIENVELSAIYRSAPFIALAQGNSVISNCGAWGSFSLKMKSSGWGDTGGLAVNEGSLTINNSFTSYDNLAGSKHTATNKYCYCGSDVANGTKKGSLCYNLNEKSSVNIIWYQTLGTDAYPTLNSDKHKKIFKTGIVYHNDELSFKGDGSQSTPFILGNEEHLKLFKKFVNEGYNSICAELEADIDYTACTGVNDMIGTSENPYTGSFIGNGKNIKIAFNVTEPVAGLFRFVKNATIADLQLSGSVTTTKNRASGLVGNVDGTTKLSHIVNKVTFNGRLSGDAAYGMLAAEVTGGATLTVSNCAFVGAIDAANAHSSGGFVGWLYENAQVSVDHSYFAPTAMKLNNYRTFTFVRFGAKNTKATVATSCFSTKTFETKQGELVTDDQMKSGEVCYKLNDYSNENATWLQTLGSDHTPTLWTAQRIYHYGDAYYNYQCTLPGSGTLADPFLIGSPQALEFFRDVVNIGYNNICGRLSADIDMSDRNWIPIGALDDSLSSSFKGTFDGDGFVISNLSGTGTRVHDMGLIGRAGDGCVVRNLIMNNVHLEGRFRAAPIVGFINGSTTIQNCGVIGLVKLSYTDTSTNDAKGTGGLAGWNHSGGSFKNSFTVYDNLHPGAVELLSDCCFSKSKVESWAASGELCYKLNGSNGSNHHWLQTIGSQPYPLQRTGKKVDYRDGIYKNIDFSEADNTTYSNTMSSDYFRVIHHGGRLFEFVATLGVKDGQGEHSFPNMDLYYKKDGSWIQIATLKNMNREKLPFEKDWSGEITAKSGTFINAHTFELQTPVFWMYPGSSTSRKEASMLWLADSMDVLPVEFKIQSNGVSPALQATSYRKTVTAPTDGSIVVVNPYINVESQEPGATASVITTINKVYSLGLWDATDNRFISTQEIPDGTQNISVSMPQQDAEHDVTVIMYGKQALLSGTKMDTTYTTYAVPFKLYPVHAIRRTNITTSYNNSNWLKWAIAFPKDADLMNEDVFSLSRAYQSDYSDETSIKSFGMSDYDSLVTDKDSLFGWFTYSDTSADGMSTKVVSNDTLSAFDTWKLSDEAKKVMTAYQYPARYIYYKVSRVIPASLWSSSSLYTVKWKSLVTNVLPCVDTIKVIKTDDWETTHRVKLRMVLNNPYPYELVPANLQKEVRDEAARQGFNGRMFLWDEKAKITIRRFCPQDEWYQGVDEVAKTIIVDGNQVKKDAKTGNYYVEVFDIQSAPFTHYYYEAIVEAGESNYPVCTNMAKEARTTTAEAVDCYSENIASILSFKATRGTLPGEVELTWEADVMANTKVTLKQEHYKYAYADTAQAVEHDSQLLPIQNNKASHQGALAGDVNSYVLTLNNTFRGNSKDITSVAHGYSDYNVGKISGHVRMPNGTAMPGKVTVTVRLVNPSKLQFNDVVTPEKALILPGFERENVVVQVQADEKGYYEVDSLCFYGSGIQYEVSAQCEGATFVGPTGTSPMVTLTLEDANYEYSNIDFVCNDVQKFSGRILYDASTIPVRDMEFYVNGNKLMNSDGKPVVTDAMGNFSFTLPKCLLTLQAKKAGHHLSGDGFILGGPNKDQKQFVPTEDYDGLVLTDSTRIRLVGRIIGGDKEGRKPVGYGFTENNLGDSIRLVLQLDGDNTSYIYFNPQNPDEKSKEMKFSQTLYWGTTSTEAIPTKVSFQSKRIVVTADNKTGEFCLDLPPAKYKVAQMYATGYASLYNEGEGLQVLDLTDSVANGKHQAQGGALNAQYTTSYCASYNRVYHAPIKLTISQSGKKYFGEDFISDENAFGTNNVTLVEQTTNGNPQYTFGYPVYKFGNEYHFTASAAEEYRYNNEMTTRVVSSPIVNRKVTIRNGFSTTKPKLEGTLNQNGQMQFTITPDNTTFSFTGTNALMTIQASVDVDGYAYEAEPLKAFVMGECVTGVEVESAMTGSPNVLDVIRDPYGANSYAYRESGTQYNWTSHYEKIEKNTFTFNFKTGLSWLAQYGFGVSQGFNVELPTATIELNHTTKHEVKQEDGEYQLTFNDRICTSSDPHDVGAMADVYIVSISSVDITKGLKYCIISNSEFEKSCAEAIRSGALKVVQKSVNTKNDTTYLVIGDAYGAAKGKERVGVYTQKHILGTLIPNLERYRDYYRALKDSKNTTGISPSDSINKYNTAIKEWQNLIKRNEQAKVEAMKQTPSKAYSISGATIEHSEQSSSYYRSVTLDGPRPTSWSITASASSKPDNKPGSSSKSEGTQSSEGNGSEDPIIDVVKAQDMDSDESSPRFSRRTTGLQGWGILLSLSLGGGGSASVSNSVRNYKTTIGGSGYSLSVNDNSYIDMDVVQMKDSLLGNVNKDFFGQINTYENNSELNGYTKTSDQDTALKLDTNILCVHNYIFIQRGGASRNPWSDVDTTFFYTENGKHVPLGVRSLRIDNPKIYVENPVVNNQPVDEPAVFTIRLANETEINDKSKYLNPSTLYLHVDERTNPDGAKLSIDGLPLRNGMQFYLNPGESAVKTLEVSRGGKPYDYENIKLQFSDNPDLWTVVDEATISVHYVPVSSPVNLSMPADNWLMNTLSQVDKDGKFFIPVQIDGFSTSQYENFDHIELQYKKQTESEDQWVNLCSYYSSDSLYALATGTKAMINAKENKIAYNFYGEKDTVEMKYDLRAVSFCRLGNGYVTRSSKVVSGTKDTRCPEVFGKPKPANGILTFSDVISLPFSEPIAYNYLDETANFSVQGYTNSSDADHSSYIYFPGTVTQSANTSTDLIVSNVDFTIEMMVKTDMPATYPDSACFFSIPDKNKNDAVRFGYIPKDDCLFAQVGNLKLRSVALKSKNFDLSKSMTHVAMTYSVSDSMVHFFVGEQEVEKTSVPSVTVNCKANGPIMLGVKYKGAMSDVRIWERVLSNYELSTKYKKILSVSERNLLGYWPMNETSGDVITDEVSGLDIKLTDVSWQTPRGISVRLDAKPMKLTPKGHLVFSRSKTEDYTLGFWFKCDGSKDNSNAMLFSAGGDDLLGKGMDKMRIGFKENNLVLISEDVVSSFGATTLNLNATWHHLAVSVNHSQNVVSFFVDGVMTNEMNADSIGGITSSYVAFGDKKFYGNIDNVTLWSLALPASYINEYYNTDFSGREAELLVNMNFEQTRTNAQGSLYTTFSTMNNVIVPQTGRIAGDTLIVQDSVKVDQTLYAPIRTGGGLQNLPFSWTSNGNELQINIKKTDASINNQQLNLVVRNVEDLNGNPMKNAQMWSVYVNRNVLEWTEKEMGIYLQYGNDSTFFISWKNNSGRVISYTIDNNANWLQLSTTRGTMQPLSTHYGYVTISDGLAPGYYSTYISLIDENNLISKLRVVVYVEAKEPSWNVNDLDTYYETMNVIGVVKKVNTNGAWYVDTNPYDIVAAFVDNKCVGKSYLKVDPVANTSYVYLSIYGNMNMNNSELEFRLWSSEEGKIYQLSTDSALHYCGKAMVGMEKPLEMRTSENKYQNIELKQGWNWVSLNVKVKSNTGVNHLFSDISQLMTGDIIKRTNANSFATLKSDKKWDDLDAMVLSPSNVYQIYAHKPAVVVASGEGFTDTDRVVTLKNKITGSWCDLAYLLEVSQPINVALSGLIAGSGQALSGSIIKSRDEFAVATKDGHWVGSLEYMRPGVGYYIKRLYTDMADSIIQVKYTNTIVAQATSSTSSSTSTLTTYPTSMPIIATFAEGEYAEGDILLAVSNGEIVGAAKASSLTSNLSPLTSEVYFLSASAAEGSRLQFVKVRDGEVVAVSEKCFDYNSELVAGSLEHPYVIDFTATNEENLYDIAGIKHLNLKSMQPHGIYIQNGRKVSK